jgi:hypothetical protein
LGACAGGPGVQAPEAAATPPAATHESESAAELAGLRQSLESTREALASAWEEVAAERLRGIDLERRVLELHTGLRSAEARRMTLESELAAALDEVLRSKASLSGGSSRALATSRIAELRAAARSADDRPAADVARVDELLERADDELEKANYPGAAYLAERAGELLRQTRLAAAAVPSLPPAPDLVVPLVPAEPRFTAQPANLRLGPGLEYERLAVLEVGETLRALARAGDWLQVERDDGLRGWIAERLAGVEQP